MSKDKPPIFNPEGWSTPNTYDLDFKRIPPAPGVYAFVNVNFDNLPKFTLELLYIGSSTNLLRRTSNHSTRRKIEEVYGGIHVYFKEAEKFKELEKEMIRIHRPFFNVIYNGNTL